MTDLLLDTSVAVPAVLASHTAHGLVMERIRGRSLGLAGHAGIETYAVLTRLPGDARLTPADAATLLAARFGEPAVLDDPAARRTIEVLADAGVAGGATYDGLVALAALAAGLPLASRDRRAEATYRRLGVSVEMIS